MTTGESPVFESGYVADNDFHCTRIRHNGRAVVHGSATTTERQARARPTGLASARIIAQFCQIIEIKGKPLL